ncbi:hypothetical protein BDZ89DRAFT_987496 [Hymenopellis radicata]|nr:hypothetical protein BDZ89DRAFT_987496 [Hymenopellis radicata]
MFKTAATKLAHNSTLPALGGHSDLRPLQDLITAEKAVLISIQKLSVDFTKAAEALRTWGIGEGDDLGDTLSASTTILSNFSQALSQFATHEHAIRDHMKSIRTREEALDELKRRRKTVVGKADGAERKLSKMSPEHKNLAMQTDTLNRLRDEIRAMDSDIMTQEAALGDFKRYTTRSMMGLKFGGLLEFSEKGTIIGEYGKLIVGEIPEDTTQPGMPRRMYNNHNRVESLVSEAYKCVTEVGFSTVPTQPSERHFEPPSLPDTTSYPTPVDQPRDSGGFLSAPHGIGMGHFLDPSDISGQQSSSSSPVTPISHQFASPASATPTQQQFSSPPTHTMPLENNRAVDDFGLMNKSEASTFNAGRFATFPVNTPQRGYTLTDGPPSLSPHHQPEQSDFASSIAEALNSPGLNGPGRISIDDPVPSYESHSQHVYAPPPGPPPGAALPVQREDSWRLSATPSEDIGLAYMATPADEEAPGHSRQDSKGMVRFGSVRDIDVEMQKRHSEEDQYYSPDRAEQSLRRVAPPSMSAEEEEKELNAAAAREVSRELDALSFSPPPGPVPRTQSQSPERSRSPPMHTPIGGSSPPRQPVSPTNWAPASPINREPSPLVPPSVPFHNTVPSHELAPTAAQSYAQAHRRESASISNYDAPSSPVGENRMVSSPPSESRALPPHPTSPLAENRPLPPQLSFSDRSNSSIRAPSSPYQTPPEFPAPRPAFTGGLRSASSTSLNSLGGGSAAPPGARMISAAAFRRPPPRMTSNGSGDFGGPGPADTSPLAFKKRLPSSPYPPGASAGARLAPSSSLTSREADDSKPLPLPGYGRESMAAKSDDDEFDYIGAYSHSDGGSPAQTDFGNKAPNTTSGYAQGRFATDLEDDLR